MFFELMAMDVKSLYSDLKLQDFGPLLFWGFWLSLLFGSLRGVDRRDEIAQITYMAFIAAFGVLFIMVFPIGRTKRYSPAMQVVLFSAMLLVPSIRWMIRRKVTELDRRVAAAKKDPNSIGAK